MRESVFKYQNIIENVWYYWRTTRPNTIFFQQDEMFIDWLWDEYKMKIPKDWYWNNGGGMVEFEDEQLKLMFLLRWT